MSDWSIHLVKASQSDMKHNSNITRYSYFGSFRSDVSNVGGNVALLTQDGKLTDIGGWYLGGSETGNVPSSASSGKVRQLYTSVMVVGILLWNVL